MKLDKYDMALANGAASEDSRPILTNISLRDGTFEVADGFMLICRKADIGKDEPITEEVQIPAKLAKQIKPTAKKPAIVKLNGKEATVTYQDEHGEVIEPKLIFSVGNEKNFPGYQQLFPKGKKHHEYAISISVLRKALDCLPRTGTLRLGFMEEKSAPVEFLYSAAGLTDHAYDEKRLTYGLIMPMFMSWEGNEWQRANEKPTISETLSKIDEEALR